MAAASSSSPCGTGGALVLEERLAVRAQYDEENKALLEDLLTQNEQLRKFNLALDLENRRLQHTLELDQRRHKELLDIADFELYDWVCDIQLLSAVSKEGWRVEFSDHFLQGLDAASREALLSGKAWSSDDGKGRPQVVSWHGAVVAVLGLYDKGKTFVLNNLTESKLPSGKKVSTRGLSFKHVEVDGGTRFILLDSEGSYSPVKVTDELSVVEKEATEIFLQELIFEMSDYFLCVGARSPRPLARTPWLTSPRARAVNDFTSLDQRYLDKLTRNLQNSSKDFREVSCR